MNTPIIITYICVLFLYNWDIIYYLIFECETASKKIKYIKDIYGSVYFERILTCLTISVILIILFTVLNTLINFGLKWFYRKDKEINSEVESYEKMNYLTEQLSLAIDEIKKLQSQIDNLKKINDNLNSKSLKVEIADISKKDYNNLLNFLNSNENKEKLIFSLNELINMLKNNNKIGIHQIYSKATYEDEMRILIEYLTQLKLLSITMYRNENDRSTYESLKIGTSFKDFLKMDL